ncbi:related to 3-oxoacyl-[acyl-carrier protein] reductase [Phialocephala subalpina]|uniref:Fatty acid synthase subunit alpha n=1 Tax=Phialocephala subalpina TaxID=576137 RepID=A0A1L7X591_9HELO|nr:related to 3-oxoacyl-[acyl-carrier protein] reductase [Phialocephala subalpina]
MARQSRAVETSASNNSVTQDQARARKLLIELLSYQFAFPVRWIETQDEFSHRPENIQRYVEVGPAKILSTMAKKTVTAHSSQAPSRSSQYQFLSSSDNKEDIYYQYPEEEEPVAAAESTPAPSVPVVEAVASVQTAVATVTASASVSAPAAAAPEIPLSASHVVLALTAQKLKKPFDSVSTQKTIRELSGGKSTLQNELIGDLGAEFGNLPDGSEDLTLEALGEALQGNFSGKPGKQLSALMSKFTSSKMPAGFNQGAIQDHLGVHWGLSKDHSIIPIAFAITAEPAARLANADAAKEFLNGLIPRYASFAGISLTPGGSGGGSSASATAMVDSASLDALKKEQRDYHMKQFDLLAKHLGIDDLQGGSKLEAAKAAEEELEKTLSQWTSEFDEQFFAGIQSAFDVRKGRTYDSSWNWVREELIRLFNDIEAGKVEANILGADDRLLNVLNKWEPSCSSMVDYLTSELADPQMQAFGREISRLGSRTLGEDPTFRYALPSLAPKTTITPGGTIEYAEVPRKISNYSRLVKHGRKNAAGELIPFVHIRKREGTQAWKYDAASSSLLLRTLEAGTGLGLTFAGKTVLVTGAGKGSIGAEVVKGLLSGGARVTVTTSRAVSSTAKFFQQMYRKYGAREASLTVLPFNQSSKKDCEALIAHIYGPNSPTGGDLDYILPFAAIPEAGELDSLDGKSELAHRAMLTNVLRLLGAVRKEKDERGIDTRPTNVILPLSPNHGTFGGDGLYAESKLGLETLFNRFYSESWSTYITICGAVIGWTRGTGLMSGNNIVAEAVEKQGVITFSQPEMAFNILALMTPSISSICEDDPVYADLTGCLDFVTDLKGEISTARTAISDESRLRKALVEENSRQHQILAGPSAQVAKTNIASTKVRRANLGMNFPNLASYEDLTGNLQSLEGMVDLSRTVVVVGFSDLSPWGSTRTRWEMEHQGEFSIEGYVEMAWIMGLVKHFEGDIKGKSYVGWVDTKTNEPVRDDEFKAKYSEYIMSHTGLRFIEPEGLGGYDPKRKEFLHEVAVEEDLPPFESSRATAEAFKLRHGDKVNISPIAGSDDYIVRVLRGAHFLVPKATSFDRQVAGQLPTGWDPVRYGIPEDIVQQVDPITLYALCCVSEALLSAGIKDPYEFYKHIHVSELAICLGTGAGSLLAMRGVYRDRYLDRPVQSDILQESFLNTMGAWINMLLLSSTGTIKSPVGACATAIESLDIGCEAIKSGNSKIAFVGGCDDFQEEMSYEFAKMKATASSADELDKGRLPSEMSRPSVTSRSGFVESAGCGAQIIMSAEVALEMGLPIYGIVAYTQMASDKIGRSVPAPGQGILTAAKESSSAYDSDLLDLEFRRRHLKESVAQIKKSHQARLARMQSRPEWSDKMLHEIESATACKLKLAQQMWGNDIRLQDPTIGPLKASLATWGLTINDIGVCSMHGTSTKANDTNEADVINKQMTHLGRKLGNPLLAVCQKSLTGHPKGAAGAWQFNGCMQMLQTGIVPGNWNADNIDDHLREFEHIVYPRDAIHMSEVRATMLTSFGFGQKGGITIAIHPKYLYTVITSDVYEEYRQKVTKRQRKANTAFVKGLMTNSIFKAKDHSPWDSGDAALTKALLDPNARASNANILNEFKINDPASAVPKDPSLIRPISRLSRSSSSSSIHRSLMDISETGLLSGMVQNMLESSLPSPSNPGVHPSLSTSVGVDVETISSINIENDVFLERNFTDAEREYCERAVNPRASFAGRWSAKEAVFKSLQVPSQGPGAGMRDIEILSDGGVPRVQFHGRAKEIAEAEGISNVQISITHSGETVTAVALAAKSLKY